MPTICGTELAPKVQQVRGGQGLRAVTESLGRVGVDLDHQPVGTRCHRGQGQGNDTEHVQCQSDVVGAVDLAGSSRWHSPGDRQQPGHATAGIDDGHQNQRGNRHGIGQKGPAAANRHTAQHNTNNRRRPPGHTGQHLGPLCQGVPAGKDRNGQQHQGQQPMG